MYHQVSPGPTTPLLTPLVTPLVTPSVTPSASRSASLNNSPAYFPTAGTGFPKISKRKLTRLITGVVGFTLFGFFLTVWLFKFCLQLFEITFNPSAVNKQSRPDLVDPSEIFLSSPPSRPSNTECTRRLPN